MLLIPLFIFGQFDFLLNSKKSNTKRLFIYLEMFTIITVPIVNYLNCIWIVTIKTLINNEICFLFFKRADYWVSQTRKYCEFCKCWITDNRPVSFST